MNRVTSAEATRVRTRAIRWRYLQLLEQHELAVAAIYDKFAQKIPRKRQFWSEIADEERAHARMVHMLDDMVTQKQVTFSESSLEMSLVLDSLAFLNSKLAYLEGWKPTHAEALCLAERVERMIVERGIFRVFAADTPEMEAEFAELLHHTQEHVQRIRIERQGKWWQHGLRRASRAENCTLCSGPDPKLI